MIRRILAAIVLTAIAAALLVAAWPQLFGLVDAPIVAQVVSLRGVDIAIAVGLAVVFGVVALVWRSARRFLGSIVALLLVFCLVSVAILASRGFDGTTTTHPAAADVTVLSWNTKGDAPGAVAIAKLALSNHADIVTLPETTLITATEVNTLMTAAGHPMWVHSLHYSLVSKSKSTSVLISTSLGAYSVDLKSGNTMVLPTVIAKPVDGHGPTIIAVHAESPRAKEMRNWRADLSWLATQCTGANTIMAGDFNSTLDTLHPHSAKGGADFGECTDAGFASHGGAVGTWPTNLPSLLGAQIDHVMYTSAWKVRSMHVVGSLDSVGSDHRPIVVTLAPSK
jgi:endonuclease/exonuclease/phosphatase (EEP) superfamily protein YafD